MPKKSSSKKPTQVQEQKNPVVEHENPSSKPKKPSNEIDQIFSGKKRKKPAVENTNKSNGDDETEKPKLMMKKNNKKKSKGAKEIGFADPLAKSRNKTADGLVIYTEEELGINKGDAGGTPLCPFDCECCF